jgi:5-methylcytosine-specific restriction endonuclease McrA
MPRKLPRNYKKEYKEYHGTAKQRKNRSMRNKARRVAGLKKGDPREVDHKKPLSKGGTNGKKNLRVVSKKVNRKKGNRAR